MDSSNGISAAQGIEHRYPIDMPTTHSFEVRRKTSFCNTQERISEEAVLYSLGKSKDEFILRLKASKLQQAEEEKTHKTTFIMFKVLYPFSIDISPRTRTGAEHS